jgi:threonine dehydratase
MKMLNVYNEAKIAQTRIQPYIRNTPLEPSIALSKISGAEVYLKCEQLQHTGSFKVRGAFNKLLSLSKNEREQGIVTASSGNHGAAVAYGLHTLQIKGKIFVPENISKAKIENIRNYHPALEFYGNDCVIAERHAREYARMHNQIYISPYNDPLVIAGQGTVALEVISQLSKIDAILVPIGGGGLISGIAGVVKALSPKTQVIGCLPLNSPIMFESIQAGHIVDRPTLPTLSDATAGGIEAGSMTFELCQQWVDDTILVSEQEIKAAITNTISHQRMIIEGASGVAVGALLKNNDRFRDKNVVVILSGANISLEILRNVLGS